MAPMSDEQPSGPQDNLWLMGSRRIGALALAASPCGMGARLEIYKDRGDSLRGLYRLYNVFMTMEGDKSPFKCRKGSVGHFKI